jgi:chromosome partitioning protein
MPAVIAFVSQKGGVGKSTLARALAAVCAHAGLKVILADLDPQQQTLMHWQQARAQNKVSPHLAVAAFADAAEALEHAAGSDLLILDTPGGASEETLEIARLSHLVVQPAGPSLDDLHPTVLLLHELTAAGIPKTRLAAALCRVLDDGEEDAARGYIEAAGYEVLAGSIPESSAYRSAHNRGRSLTETSEQSFNGRADALLEALLTKVAGLMPEAEDEIEEGARGRRRGDAA